MFVPATTELPELLRVRDVAAAVRVHEVSVRRWIADGTIGSVKVGGVRRVPRAKLDRLIEIARETDG
jgi:excisionase family DNA binding protein